VATNIVFTLAAAHQDGKTVLDAARDDDARALLRG
jgi:hypothetical protein